MIISLLVLILSYYSHYVLNQKLQVIEKKAILLNIILEARRYEKNYFLYLNGEYVAKALSYVNQARDTLSEISEKYGEYALTKNLDEKLNQILQYEKSLTTLLSFHTSEGLLKASMDYSEHFGKYRKIVQQLGRRITTDFEYMLREERTYVQNLILKSKIYHSFFAIFKPCL